MVPPTNPPPSTVQFLDRLIFQLSRYHTNTIRDAQSTTQYLQNQPFAARFLPHQLSNVKPLLLSLHCLFPNELLLALDILDRGLARRFIRADTVASSANISNTATPSTGFQHGQGISEFGVCPDEDIFLVISASTASSSSSSSGWPKEKEKSYEVRLQAWNCTCPTFSLVAFRDTPPDLGDSRSITDSTGSQEPFTAFGGMLTRESAKISPPVCKHLLACLLMSTCPGVVGTAAEGSRLANADEIGGFCAGWGG